MTPFQPHRPKIAAVLFALAAIIGHSQSARADGGRLVRVERINGWIVSVFVTPDPPRVGPVDVSVLLQEAASGSVIADAEIAVTLNAAGAAEGATTSAPANREHATNKLLQSALLDASSPGDWQGTIDCRVGKANAEIPFTLQIASSPPAWTKLAPWILWPFAATAIFVAHRTLDRKRAYGRPAKLPSPKAELTSANSFNGKRRAGNANRR